MPGATPEFKQQLKAAFDSIQVGQTFTFRRTFTEKDEAKRLMRAVATFINQDGTEVLLSRFSGFPAHVRLAR